MSHTFRRQQHQHEYSWVLREWVYVDGSSHRYQIDPRSKEGRKKIAEFHSDGARVMGGVPGWFCNLYVQRGARQKARRELQRYMSDPDHEVMIDANHHHNAGWLWW